MKKIPVAIIGATGYVGQRLILLLKDHPYFEITRLVASPKSAGMTYAERMGDGFKFPEAEIPEKIWNMTIHSLDDLDDALGESRVVFSAMDMDKQKILELEERIAKTERIVLSNNSAHRLTPDVPLLIPEINPEHLEVLKAQKKRLGTKTGFIIAKPNCSIQSYVPALTPLLPLGIEKVFVATYQAVSGAGKRLNEWPEMQNNMIPYIGGEEAKSEREPLKIWGEVKDGEIKSAAAPVISAHCFRVAVEEGHSAAVSFSLKEKVQKEDILKLWEDYNAKCPTAKLPTGPEKFIHYMTEDDRPQAKLDVEKDKGMGVFVGRLREDPIFDWKFVSLSHNTLRGAAGGSVLSAEYLYDQGIIR